jgi:hypothetical protein
MSNPSVPSGSICPPESNAILESQLLRHITRLFLHKFYLTDVLDVDELVLDAAIECCNQIQSGKAILKPIPWAKTVIYRKIMRYKDKSKSCQTWDPVILERHREKQYLKEIPKQMSSAYSSSDLDKLELVQEALVELKSKDEKGWRLLNYYYLRALSWAEIAQDLYPQAVQDEGLEKVTNRLRQQKKRTLDRLRHILVAKMGLWLVFFLWCQSGKGCGSATTLVQGLHGYWIKLL